jgi:glucosamine 6-phosphate synthetase-like amidotransferase/phosphosugar isomerase protein
MCCLLGFSGFCREGQWGQTYEILHQLFLAATCRGVDATGFAALAERYKRPYEHRVVVAKAAVPANEFCSVNPTWLQLHGRRCACLVGHTRMATHGDAKAVRNAHPFSGGGYHLTHNGAISNARDLIDQFSLRMESETDSEVLLHLVRQEGDPVRGLKLCLREARGSLAIAMLEERRGLIWFARRGRPTWLAKLRNDRRFFYAFEAVLGPKAVQQVEMLIPTPDDTVLAISPAGLLVSPLGAGIEAG